MQQSCYCRAFGELLTPDHPSYLSSSVCGSGTRRHINIIFVPYACNVWAIIHLLLKWGSIIRRPITDGKRTKINGVLPLLLVSTLSTSESRATDTTPSLSSLCSYELCRLHVYYVV
ncbi:hypothetical protein DL93DRAFT_2082239, partial [Clavulina sp. PMI_390]